MFRVVTLYSCSLFILRFLIWVQRGSIRRSFLDGTEVQTLAEIDDDVSYRVCLAVDYKTSHVYWISRNQEILQCDLDGKNRRDLDGIRGNLRKLSVLNSIIYYQRKEYNRTLDRYIFRLYRTDDEQEAHQLVYTTRSEILDLKILPAARDFEDSNENPCANNSCSHMCVQSSQNTHACLCHFDYVMHRESGNCIGNDCFGHIFSAFETHSPTHSF